MFHFQHLFRGENGYCCTGEETWCLFVLLHTESLVWLDHYSIQFFYVVICSTWRHGISLSTLYRRSMLWPGLSLLVSSSDIPVKIIYPWR